MQSIIIVLEEGLVLVLTLIETRIGLVVNVIIIINFEGLGLLFVHRDKVLHSYKLGRRQEHFFLGLLNNCTATSEHCTILDSSIFFD